jgi:hypothetical protein
MPHDIVWYVWGNNIKKANLSFSSDGGRTWDVIASGFNTTVGWNKYSWNSGTSTSRGRIKIECLSDGGELVSADGSHRNFFVMARADLIPHQVDLGYCTIDDEGLLVVNLKNKGTAAAGPSTTRVRFIGNGTASTVTPPIPAGDTSSVRFAIPNGCFNPDCDFEITIDANDTVVEANERNNRVEGGCVG